MMKKKKKNEGEKKVRKIKEERDSFAIQIELC